MQHEPVIEQTALSTRLTVVGSYREFVQHVLLPVGGIKLVNEWAQFVHRYIGYLSPDTLTVNLPDIDTVRRDINWQSLQDRKFCAHVMPAVVNGYHGGLMISGSLVIDGRINWSISLHT